MCKHGVLVPTEANYPAVKKVCKPVMLGRIWQASRRGLALDHTPSHHFACSQWQTGHRPTTSYIVYRWLFFLSALSIGITSFACQRLPPLYDGPKVELNYFKWFIYFTNWGYMLIVLQAALALAVVYKYKNQKTYCIPCDDEEIPLPRRQKTPFLCRLYWLVHNIATDLAFVITLVYWTLVHDPKMHEVNALNILVHGCNSLAMLLELAVTAHPIQAIHALFGAGAGLMYGIFSAFYWAVGGTDRVGLPAIYPALDWNKPGSAFGFVALCAVVMMFAHAIATVLAILRMKLAAKIRPSGSHLDKFTLPTH
ncbi:protein rolling stone-like isoform X1 [Pieris brassicae]|uniref:protein rolling stone-like isoform X1 n=1 Tax=Pieris brassicae TaxID=7116 RepID=UPI001E65F676|nr:protein rolling stone-like isoform X1 [Pieris brassicae]